MPRARPPLILAAGLAGPVSAGLFAASVIGFAAVREDGYTHATKAISELGALGAPHAVAFNAAGLIAPGLLMMLLAAGLAARLERGRIGAALLATAGAGLTASGLFPLDMSDMAATTTVLHAIGAMACGFVFAVAVFPLGGAMRRTPGFEGLGRITPWFALAPFVNVGWQVQWRAAEWFLPGWGQRIAFAGVFLWVALAGIALLRARRPLPSAPARG